MQKQELPKNVLKALKSVRDPHTKESVYKMGMIKNIKVSDKKISMKLVPPMTGVGCESCAFISLIIEEIKERLNEFGYEAEVEVGF